jgi:hypothetical protein
MSPDSVSAWWLCVQPHPSSCWNSYESCGAIPFVGTVYPCRLIWCPSTKAVMKVPSPTKDGHGFCWIVVCLFLCVCHGLLPRLTVSLSRQRWLGAPGLVYRLVYARVVDGAFFVLFFVPWSDLELLIAHAVLCLASPQCLRHARLGLAGVGLLRSSDLACLPVRP